MLKCPVCSNRLIKSQPRFADSILKLFYAAQLYQCSSASCWHGYLSKPKPRVNQSKQLPCTDELKAKLALKVVEGQSVYLLSRGYHLDPKQISQWHWHLVNNAGILFTQIAPQRPLPNEKALVVHLLGQVKQLKQDLQITRQALGANNIENPLESQKEESTTSDQTRSNWVHSSSKEAPKRLSTESTP